MEGGAALGKSMLALGHAMAQALGGRYGLPHGARTRSSCRPRCASTARRPGRDRAFWRRRRRRRPRAGRELARLGGFERLRDQGVPEDDLGELAGLRRFARRRTCEPTSGDAGRDRRLFRGESVGPADQAAPTGVGGGGGGGWWGVGLSGVGGGEGGRCSAVRLSSSACRPLLESATGDPRSFDVLVIGSGASGLAAAVSAEGRRSGRARDELRSSRATRRRRKAVSRPPSARTTRRSSTPRTWAKLARDREPRARRGSHLRGARRDPLARGARRRVHARERRLPARALRRREPQAPAPGRRPNGHAITTALREWSRPSATETFPKSPLVGSSRRPRAGGRAAAST